MFKHIFKGLKAAVAACLVAVVAAVALQGCTTAPEAEKQLRVAVFVGSGARSVGMFRWIQLVDQAPELKAIFVDGSSIRNGALRNADAVVMPGGKSYVIADELGKEGADELRRFIRDGGSYIGTCAGAILMLDDLSLKRKMLGVAPFKKRIGSWGGESMLRMDYTKEAALLSGIKKGWHQERFNGGPVMDPTQPIAGADFKVFARFSCNLHTNSEKPDQPSMGGGASVVAGTYGKGRVWLSATHPEYYPKTWDAVKAAFKFTTGCDVTLSAPQRRRGQLATGWWCDPSPGPKAAELACRLIQDNDIDLEPYSSAVMQRNGMRHIDALVVPDATDAGIMKRLSATNGVMSQLKAFMDRGGKVVTWGSAASSFAPHSNLLIAASMDAVPALLRDLKNQPTPAPRSSNLEKVENPVRVSMIFGNGVGGFSAVRWIQLLSCTPDCVFTAVSGADVRAGALANADLYIAPGGSSSRQAATLGAAGCSNLVEFVRNGGGYFGTCAGCYLALSPAANDRPSSGRLCFAPYCPERKSYRGGAHLKIRFTEDAKLFGLTPGAERVVRYHGGPVLLDSNPIPGADIHTVAEYACAGVFATDPLKEPVMSGTPAIIAGTFWKGRLVCTSPHPESFLHTQDMIRGGLKYITGRSFEADLPQRTRGNLSVGFHGSNMGKDGAMLASRLFREPSLDVRPVDGEAISYGELEHCDALVLCHPEKKIYTPFIHAFAKNGGRIFVLGLKSKTAFVPEGLPNVAVYEDAEALRKALLMEEAGIADTVSAPSLESKVRDWMDENMMTGLSIAFVKGDKVVYQQAFGYRDRETREPLDINDIFRIASISKSFSGMSIMQLVEAGKISLDDDINDILGMDIRNPRYPDIPVTIRMLLSHTSSMNDGGGYRDLTYVDNTKTDINLIREKAWLPYQPGKGYRYCNRGLNIMGLVIEKVSGERFDEYVLNHILRPIGADNSSFNLDKVDDSTITKFYQYSRKRKELVPGGGYLRINEKKVADGTYELGKDGVYWSPTGGMKMSAPNLAKWMITLKNGGVAPNGNRIISEKGCKTLLTPVIDTTDLGGQYALTIRHETRLVEGKRLVGHTGSAHGLVSCMFFCPEEDWGIVCISSSVRRKNVGGKQQIRLPHFNGLVNLFHDSFISQKQEK